MHPPQTRLPIAEIQRLVRSEAVQILAHHGRYSLLAGLAGLLVALGWLYQHRIMDPATLSLWGSAMLLVTAGAQLLPSQALQPTGASREPRRLEWRFGLKNMCSGALWGILPVLGPYEQGPTAQAVVCILLSAVTLAATGLNAPSKLAFN